MPNLDVQLLPFARAASGRSLAAAALTALAGIALFAIPMPSHATEEPEFKVIRELATDITVREYAAYVVAEVVVPGPAGDAGNQAFPILAGYIYGKNNGDRKLAMTAPVTQTPIPVKLAMTAPVTQMQAPEGYLVQFVLPREVSMSTAPEPMDARIHLREVPPGHVAVIQYSGFWSDSNYKDHLTRLQDALHAANLVTTGQAVYSRYNPPFTPWFLRRNEIWLRLAEQR
jgi:hypothetical protein